MNTSPRIGGIHHITAIASSASGNLAFFRQVLGLRLVKRTVNFDDPYTYHLYYGDRVGSPGTIITFFPWEQLPPGKPGAGMVSSIAFGVPPGAMGFWRDRLRHHNLAPTQEKRFGDPVLHFKDPHGLDLELIGRNDLPDVEPWEGGTVPEAHAIRGFHSATALVRHPEPTREVLVDLLGMAAAGREGDRLRFHMPAEGALGAAYDLVVDPRAPVSRSGGGTVHHIAFRTPTDEAQLMWRRRLQDGGQAVTAVRDRKYFRSIYFNEPGGVLFEIATDAPGFAVDETVGALGRSLTLPARYEPLRDEIEARLPPLQEAREAAAAV